MYPILWLGLAGASVGGIVFVVLYDLKSPWRGNAAGKLFMGLAGAMAAKDSVLLLLASGVRVPLWVLAMAYVIINWFVWWRILLLLQLQGWRADRMAAWIYTGLRTAAQALWGLLVARAADVGISLPSWLESWFVETLFVAGGIGLVTAAIRWLETRKGDGVAARVARWVARVVMLGLSRQPVYVPPIQGATPATVTFDTSQTRSALPE